MENQSVLILGLASTIATVITAMISAVVAIFVAKLNTKATTAAKADAVVAKKTEEVKQSLQVNRTVTEDKLHEIKTLVNGGVEKSLRIASVALRRVAATTNNPGDIEAARVAEAALAEHIAAQLKVDKAHQEAQQTQQATHGPTIGLGEAVGEMGSDVKEVKRDVKDLKANQAKE